MPTTLLEEKFVKMMGDISSEVKSIRDKRDEDLKNQQDKFKEILTQQSHIMARMDKLEEHKEKVSIGDEEMTNAQTSCKRRASAAWPMGPQFSTSASSKGIVESFVERSLLVKGFPGNSTKADRENAVRKLMEEMMPKENYQFKAVKAHGQRREWCFIEFDSKKHAKDYKFDNFDKIKESTTGDGDEKVKLWWDA